MTKSQMHDFASTPDKGLPQYVSSKADGAPPMTNTTFQQSEPMRHGKRPAWMESAARHAAGDADKGGIRHLADGQKGMPPMPAGAYRVKSKKITVAEPMDAPQRRPRMYGNQPGTQMMADGKKGHWMADAFKNAGKKGHSLHASLHVPADQKIPASKLSHALHSNDPHMRKMANLARNANP